MPIWSDFFKLFDRAYRQDPLAARIDTDELQGAGVPNPDAIPTLGGQAGGDNGYFSGRQTNDMVDLNTITNRNNRYKEYERLRAIPEIEMAMTVFADEACVAGDTKIATPFGMLAIEDLAKNQKEEFLVYCWDFEKNDYTLGWAYAPRLVKHAKTVRVMLDDGSEFRVTPDHRILLRSGEWINAGDLKFKDELMPFYRIKPDRFHNKLPTNQHPRIFTHTHGWMTERQFTDRWAGLPVKNPAKQEAIAKTIRLITSGLSCKEASKLAGRDWCGQMKGWLAKEGFTLDELRYLEHKQDRRRVVCITDGPDMDVYDLSVRDHKCFCTDSVVMHNCQWDEEGNVCKLEVKNPDVKEELEFLFYHRQMLNVNRKLWNWAKNLFIFGDFFMEIVINPDNPKEGIYKVMPLPPESIYRIETIKGKVLEFQQSKEGPDYQILQRAPVHKATDTEMNQSTAIRFSPEQIIHMRIGDDRKTFYPYGVSLIEAARGPAHQLRLMEDAMVVYRLTRAPERRVFYVDVGQLPPFKAEAFIERMKDQFRKRKVSSNRGSGASGVEERWHPPAADEDYWLPIRPQSNTRIETLPGAENLGEIDDAIYFRNKLFTALNMPKNYFSNEDPNATRITLSAQDIKFARMIERLQSYIVDALWEIADRHLKLRGYPSETYSDLKIKMTPPSDWRELSRSEVINARIGWATGLKGAGVMADYDLYTKWLKYNDDDTEEMLSRLKLQKLEDLKLQVLAQNPQLLGIGIPGQDPHPGQEMGTEPGGPSPNPGIDGQQPPPPPDGGQGPDAGAAPVPQGGPQPTPGGQGMAIEEPDEDSIKRYDLEIQDYAREMDIETPDWSVGDLG